MSFKELGIDEKEWNSHIEEICLLAVNIKEFIISINVLYEFYSNFINYKSLKV